MRRLALALAVLIFVGCASGPAVPPLAEWQSPHGRDHPLAGRIWSVGQRRFVDPTGLLRRLAPARFVLLGEQHDNADHHRLQAWILRELIARGRRPAVGFEMLSLDDVPALEQYLAARPGDAAGLGLAVGWSRAGWPDWHLYQPIADAALAAGLGIAATDLGRATVDAVRRHGLAAMDPALQARLGLDRPLSAASQAEMSADLADAHCGHPPAGVIEGMVAIQRARDAHMAWRLVSAVGPQGAVLIAGAGHVRRDRGVPATVARLEPGASVASLAFLEVSPGATEPDAYAVRSSGGRALPYDYVWFTPRQEDTDPCERFRRSLQRLRERS
jgi:uncharacterized iron-regulated protein